VRRSGGLSAASLEVCVQNVMLGVGVGVNQKKPARTGSSSLSLGEKKRGEKALGGEIVVIVLARGYAISPGRGKGEMAPKRPGIATKTMLGPNGE